MANPINRRLTYQDEGQQWQFIEQHDIAGIAKPVVILGGPGMGKTILTKWLGTLPGMKYCGAGRFKRADKPETLIAHGERIIVDGLDEIASSTLGGAVDAVLSQLSKMDNPPFIVSCREADWQGATDRIQIEDDYGVAPVLLRLEPFSRDDAVAFLSNEFPEVDGTDLLQRLAKRGVESLYKNPLTLRLLGEVAQERDPLPEHRAELLRRACSVMLREVNPRHKNRPHVNKREEELLLAAGAVCAAQVLCGPSGVYAGPYPDTPGDSVHVADIAVLPFAKVASDALKTRLFQAEGESVFCPIHRVVAEYLGAKWLAKCVDSTRSERRIFSLFRSGDGVPTSLRGLHAWMAHFSARAAKRCIAADPYAVLRYGDAETIGREEARALLAALKTLSEADPYFGAEDWGRHPASGLMRSELKEDVLAVIGTPGRHTHLAILLLGAMPGTEVADELGETLAAIMFDPARTYAERSYAAGAVREGTKATDWEAAIEQLLGEAGSESARLACEIVRSIGTKVLSLRTSVNAVLAHLGLTDKEMAGQSDGVARYVPSDVFDDLDTAALAGTLDMITVEAKPNMRKADFVAKWQITSLVRHLTLRVLEAEPDTAAERIWAWLEWIDGARGYGEPESQRLTELLRKKRTLRAGLLEHGLLTLGAGRPWKAVSQLHQMKLGLYPSADDLAGLIRALRARAGDGSIDAETWRDLLQLDRSEEGITDVVRTAAVTAARGDAELLAVLDEMNTVIEPEWKKEQEQLEAEEKAERQKAFQVERDKHMKWAHEVAAGNGHALAYAAEVYLGRYFGFDGCAGPVARLQELLGSALTNQTLAGFVAVLGRGDLPTAMDIAETHAKGRHCFVEAPMICGIAEMVRQGLPIDRLDHGTLAAVYMAWEWAPESGTEGQVDIGPAIEAVLFTDEQNVEGHFRTSIEPVLAANIPHFARLERLARDSRRRGVGGRLAVEWLQKFPKLPLTVATELMSCAVKNAPREMLAGLLAGWETSDAPDEETLLLWLSAVFVVDFEQRRGDLEEAAAAHRGLIWRIRARLADDDQVVMSHLSIPQLVFVVDGCGPHWKSVGPPTGGSWGDQSAWDATKFIERAIHEIASRPAPGATEALQQLIEGPAATYANTARHALALQRKVRRDFEYTAPRVNDLQAVMNEHLPETIDDMLGYVADHLDALQEKMHASNTDMWETYWTDEGPRGEEYCRNRLVDHLSSEMGNRLQIEPEARMPERKRADFVAIRGATRLPIEIKGQWHDEVWDAACGQLDAFYTREWRARGRGVYIVLWFGDVSDKRLPRHPDGLAGPESPDELREMLTARVPEHRRSQLYVFVLDIARPKKSGRARRGVQNSESWPSPSTRSTGCRGPRVSTSGARPVTRQSRVSSSRDSPGT